MAKKVVHFKGDRDVPLCGTKSKTPEMTYEDSKVTCKRCLKKIGKPGNQTKSDQNQTKSDQNQKWVINGSNGSSDFDKLDMSKYDNDSRWTSIKDELPPESIDKISTVECLYGIENHDELAIIALQHIHQDISSLGFSRVTHWKYRK